jgi:Kef-type K+ transport system membrane component KefB
MTGNAQLVLHLFLQLVVILVICRLVGRLLRPLGQAQVVGEMVAGVLLGPSLFGLLAPEAQAALFPKTLAVGESTVGHPSMSILYALSQIGLVLYMFLVGLNFNTRLLSRHSRDAVLISLSGILIPLLLGGALGAVLAGRRGLFGEGVLSWQAALFVASATSITAFPVMARILYEAGLTRSRLGTLALGAAATNDAFAWVLLASVVAVVQGSSTIALLAIGGGVLYTLLMLLAGRPLLRVFERVTEREDGLSPGILVPLLALLMLCAWATDWVGIHSVFGAFIAGVAMPRGRFAREVTAAIEPITISLLVPVFFVYSGLNTRMSLLVEPSLLWVAAAVIFLAFACKLGGCTLASRLGGMSWRESAALGTLMNARGMMELILVNIALEKGIITPGLFTILVLMAIVTTLVASPLFRFLYGRDVVARSPEGVEEAECAGAPPGPLPGVSHAGH